MFLLTLSSSDAVALSLLGSMFLTLLAVGSLIMVMVRNVQNRDTEAEEVDKLLQELEEEEKKPAPHAGKEEKPTRQDWEKEPDWWKNE